MRLSRKCISLEATCFALVILAGANCRGTERARAGDDATRVSETVSSTGAVSMDDPLVAPGHVSEQAFADLTYLASDEMRGRYTGTAENRAAAAYIAEVFERAGATAVTGQTIRSTVRLIDREAVTEASVGFGGSLQRHSKLELPGTLLPITRFAVELEAAAVYLPEASLGVATAAQVKGKIVVTDAGGDTAPADPRAWLDLARKKRIALEKLGAAGLVEVYRSQMIPFKRLVEGVNTAGMTLDDGGANGIPLLWGPDGEAFAALRKSKPSDDPRVRISVKGVREERIVSDNVIAVLPGTDPSLASEYIAVTAHFDHIGVIVVPGLIDSINNGARDNGMGTAALLEVARRWKANPGRRPLLLMAWTAEEVGLLGSGYWAEHPTIPLSRIKFNFNLDGAGYDDTTGVTINGYGRTSAQATIDAAVAKTGLAAMPDPVPQYGLFRQSDNYSLAAKGIPAINMAPGFGGFSEELMKYYHQPADEITAVDPRYLQRYADAAVAVAKALSDMDELPGWVAEDEFAPVAKQLYAQ